MLLLWIATALAAPEEAPPVEAPPLEAPATEAPAVEKQETEAPETEVPEPAWHGTDPLKAAADRVRAREEYKDADPSGFSEVDEAIAIDPDSGRERSELAPPADDAPLAVPIDAVPIDAVPADAVPADAVPAEPPPARQVAAVPERIGTAEYYGAPGDLFLYNARVWDGVRPSAYKASVLIRGGVIEAISFDLDIPEDVRVIDASGMTIIPGLIDAHVHLTSIASSGYDEAEWESHVRQGLRAYLACGVTTVLDTGIQHEQVARLRGWVAEGQPAPNFEVLGWVVSPPEGYVTTVLEGAPAHGTPEALTAHLDELTDLGAAGVKVTMEEGFLTRIWPLQTPEMQAVITREADARDLPIYVHAISPKEHGLAMDMGAHAMVHPLDWPHRGTINRLRETDTAVMSTIGIYDMFRVGYDRDRLTDPLTRLVVPEALLANAADPAVKEGFQEEVMSIMMPKLPGMFSGLAEWQLNGRTPVERRIRSLEASVAELHRSGVTVIVGSDAGNWPILPSSFHGISTVRELELWEEAGISPLDTLTAATRLPAEVLGVSDRVGTLEPGKAADLVVLEQNPLLDVSAVRAVRFTVKDGVARTPEQWMND